MGEPVPTPRSKYAEALDRLVPPDSGPAGAGPVAGKYARAAEELALGKRADVQLALGPSVRKPAARQARVLAAAARTGLPITVLDTHLEEVEARGVTSKTDPATLVATAPTLAEALRDRNLAAAVSDDIDELSALEYVFGRWKRMAGTLPTFTTMGGLQGVVQEEPGAVQRAWAAEEANLELADIGMKQKRGEATEAELARAAELEAIARQDLGADSFWKEGVTGATRYAAQWQRHLKYGGVGMGIGAVGGLVLGGAAGAAVTGGPGVVPGALHGARVGAGLGGRTGMVASAYSLEAGLAYREFAGVVGEDGARIDPKVAAFAADVYGGVAAGLEALALDRVLRLAGGDRILATLSRDKVKTALAAPTVQHALAKVLGRYGQTVGTEVTTEALQQGAQVLAQELAKMASPGEFPAEFHTIVPQMVAAGRQTLPGIMFFGLPAGAAGLALDVEAVQRAREGQDFMQALADGAKASKTRERLPDHFRKIVDRIAGESGQPEVFTSVRAWQTYFQEAQADPRDAYAQVVGSVAGYDEAVARGGDLVIPTGAWAAKIAGSPAHDALLPHTRLSPGDPTPAEVQAYLQDPEKAIQETLTSVGAALRAAETDPLTEFEDRFVGDVERQAEAAGVAPEVARKSFALLRANVRAMTDRFNRERRTRGLDEISAEELYRDVRIEIVNGAPVFSFVAPAPKPARAPATGAVSGAVPVRAEAAATAPAAPREPRTTYAFSIADPAKQYPLRYRLMELDEIVTSHDTEGRQRPDYPQQYQPWDRTTMASRGQVQAMSTNSAAASMLVEQYALDRGTPIVNKAGVVLSGNARTLATVLARNAGNEAWSSYQEAVRARARELGLDPAGMRLPFLVRETSFDMDDEETIRFAAEANGRVSKEPTPAERAKLDAQRLTPELLSAFPTAEKTTIEQTLLTKEGAAWVTKFLDGTGPNEWGRFLDKVGRVGRHGIESVTLALFFRIFGGDYGDRVLRTFTEAAGESKANLERGLFNALPRLARLQGLIDIGEVRRDFEIRDDVMAALDVWRRIRAEGLNLRAYVEQQAMFGRELEPFQEAILRVIDAAPLRGSLLTEFLQEYANRAMEQEPPSQGMLLGTPITRADLVEAAVEKILPPEEAEGQARLLAQGPRPPELPGFQPAETLTPQEREIETRFAAMLATDMERWFEEYDALPETQGGKIINPDLVKTFSPDFQADGRLSAAVHEPSSAFTKLLIRRAMNRPTRGPVLILAGGGGSGKTTAIERVLDVSEYDLVLDVVLGTERSARNYLRAAAGTGREVVVAFIHRPIEGAVSAAVKRATKRGEKGRVVAVPTLAGAHYGAQDVVLTLAAEVPEGVQFLVIDNSRKAGEVRLESVDWLREQRYTSLGETLRRAREAYDAERDAGRVLDAHRRAFEAGLRDALAGELEGRPTRDGGRGGLSLRARELAELHALENLPPLTPEQYVDNREWHERLRSPYVDENGAIVRSSREVPFEGQIPEVGTWRLDDVALQYGREVAQLREVAIEELEPTELDAEGNLFPDRQADAERYAQWIREGVPPAPPIEVVETDTGKLRISDGHRRYVAAKMAGKQTILAWISPTMDHPQGMTSPDGVPLRVGATLETVSERPELYTLEKDLRPQILNPDQQTLYQSAFHGTRVKELEGGRFSTRFMGTGEGAQAFGWGLYFASQKGLAEYYREKVIERGPDVTFPEGLNTDGLQYSPGTDTSYTWLDRLGDAVGDATRRQRSTRPTIDMRAAKADALERTRTEAKMARVMAEATANLYAALAELVAPIDPKETEDLIALVTEIQNRADQAKSGPIWGPTKPGRQAYISAVDTVRKGIEETIRVGREIGAEGQPAWERRLWMLDRVTDPSILQERGFDDVGPILWAAFHEWDTRGMFTGIQEVLDLRHGGPKNFAVQYQARAEMAANAEERLGILTPDDFEAKERGQLFEVEIPDNDELGDYDAPILMQPRAVLDRLVKGEVLPAALLEEAALLDEAGIGRMTAAQEARLAALRKEIRAWFTERIADPRDLAFWIGEKDTDTITLRAKEYSDLLLLVPKIVEIPGDIRDLSHGNAEAEASLYLASLGIPGHRFANQATRGYGAQSERREDNYVIYDEERIQVVRTFYQKAQQNTAVMEIPQDPAEPARDPHGNALDMLVVHNLDESNLLFADRWLDGKLPMPSLAVARTASPFLGFGQITLLGGPETVDPRKTPTFDSDIWSPRFPRVSRAVDVKAVRALGATIPQDVRRGTTIDLGRVRSIIEYIASTTSGVEFRKILSLATVGETRITQSTFRALFLAAMADEDGNGAVWDEVRAEVAGYAREHGLATEEDIGADAWDHALEVVVDRHEERTRFGTALAARIQGPPTMEVVDRTRQRRRRVPVTLTRVLRRMKKERLRGGELQGARPSRPNEARAFGARRFSVLSQVQRARDRIQPAEVMHWVHDKFWERWREVASGLELFSHNVGPDELLGDVLVEYYEQGKGVAEILRALRTEEEIAEATTQPDYLMEVAQDIEAFAEDLRDAPTKYFEAKPTRAMGLGEFRAAILPPDASEDVETTLKKHGIPVVERWGLPEDPAVAEIEDPYDPDANDQLRWRKVTEVAKRLKVLFQDGDDRLDDKRGFIQIVAGPGTARKFRIGVLEKADLSTLLHESGHLYLEVLHQFATRDDAPESLRTDLRTILDWMGVESFDQVETKHHEQFARAFEAYLMEGRAPSLTLAGAFARFRAWLTSVYRQIRSLNVDLTPDVRRVMDRLLATEEEIERAEMIAGGRHLFPSAESVGMTATEWEAYRKLAEDATTEAKTALEVEMMQDVKRETRDEWKRARKRVHDEVAEEVNQRPVYRALGFLRHGTLPGGAVLPEGLVPVKLNTADLKAALEARGREGELNRRFAFTHANDGANLEDTAAALGFANGEDLVTAVLEAPRREDAISEEATARLEERYGSLFRDTAARQEAALDALHKDRRTELLYAELRALARKGNKGAVGSLQALKAIAERYIGNRPSALLRPDLYTREAARAAEESAAALARGETDLAFDAKRRQLLNVHLYRAARDAKHEGEATVRYLRLIQAAPAQRRIGKAGADYLENVNGLLEKYELRPSSNRGVARRQRLREWVQEQVSAGLDAIIDEQILDEAHRKHWKELTVDELRTLRDAIRNIEHLARLKLSLLTSKGRRDFDDAIVRLVRNAKENLFDLGPVPVDPQSKEAMEHILASLRRGDATLKRPEELIRRLDAGDTNGPWHTYVWNVMTDALVDEHDLSVDYTAKLIGLLEKMPKELRAKLWDQVTIPEIGQIGKDGKRIPLKMTWAGILAAALNTGNAGNYGRLISGRPADVDAWGPSEVEAILKHLTPEHWDFVQDVWDLLEGLWPRIVAQEKRLTGVAPPKVDATPFKRFGKAYRGGYYPLVYSRMYGGRAARLQEARTTAELFEAGYSRWLTPHGHTIKRVENYSEPLHLDLSVIPAHLHQVLHDLTHREALLSVHKILQDARVREALTRHLGVPYLKAIDQWLRDIANDRIPTELTGGNSFWERFARKTRMNATIVAIGAKPSIFTQNFTNYVNVLDGISAAYLAKGIQEFENGIWPTVKKVHEKSGHMRHRFNSIDRDVRDQMQALLGKRGMLSQVRRYSLSFHGSSDACVAYPAWLGAYYSVLDGKVPEVTDPSEESAIRWADHFVRTRLGSANTMDLAPIQRGGELLRAMTMFYGWFSMTYNRYGAVSWDVRRSRSAGRLVRDWPRYLARGFAFWITVSVLSEILAGRHPDDPEDPEEWLAWMGRKVVAYPLGTIPILRDIAGSLEWGSQARPNPTVQLAQAATNVLRTAGGIIEGDADLEEIAKSGTRIAGYSLGLPTTQAEITGGYLFDVMAGDEAPESPVEFLWKAAYRRPPENRR